MNRNVQAIANLPKTKTWCNWVCFIGSIPNPQNSNTGSQKEVKEAIEDLLVG